MKSIDNMREYVLTAASVNATTRAVLAGYIDGIEREVADMVPLPLDADGVPIHVGDVLEFLMGNSETIYQMKVESLRYNGSGVWEAEDECGSFGTSRAHHYHAPTVEDVLREFTAKLIERGELTNGGAQTIAEYAAKLTLRGDE